MQFDQVMKLLGALEKESVKYVLIGGVAINFHGIPRATQDIDLFVRLDQDNIARLRAALHSIYDDPAIDEITFKEMTEYAIIRYGTPDDFNIDLIGKLVDFACFDNLQAENRLVEGVRIPLATPKTLYRLKNQRLGCGIWLMLKCLRRSIIYWRKKRSKCRSGNIKHLK